MDEQSEKRELQNECGKRRLNLFRSSWIFVCGWLVGWRLVRDKDLVFCLFGLLEDPCAKTCDEAKRFCLKVHLSTTWRRLLVSVCV